MIDYRMADVAGTPDLSVDTLRYYETMVFEACPGYADGCAIISGIERRTPAPDLRRKLTR